MLRRFLIVLGVVLVVIGVVLFIAHAVFILAGYLVIGGLILTAALAFERWRYRPSLRSPQGKWQVTGERFYDPETKKLMEVLYNPDTGERQYREASSDR